MYELRLPKVTKTSSGVLRVDFVAFYLWTDCKEVESWLCYVFLLKNGATIVVYIKSWNQMRYTVRLYLNVANVCAGVMGLSVWWNAGATVGGRLQSYAAAAKFAGGLGHLAQECRQRGAQALPGQT